VPDERPSLPHGPLRCSIVRILVAGASGVIGRATLPHLAAHHIVGLTRSHEKLESLRGLGAEPVVCDVYDYETLLRVSRRARPQIVVNFLTDLSAPSTGANNRVRREGARNVRDAAVAVGAERLVVESVAFTLEGDAARAVAELEQGTSEFAGDSLILRFGRLWGPGTFHTAPPPPPAIHVRAAGVEAARLLVDGPPGTYVLQSG
jgi:uncharacterized protein YbjT (DUF2867 family)